MPYRRSPLAGFTLIELLLVLGISTFISLTLFRTIWEIVELSTMSKQLQLAQEDMVRAGKRIEYLVQNADSVESVDENQLLVGIRGSSEVIRIFLDRGTLYVERHGETDALTNRAVALEGVSFFEAKAHEKTATFIGYTLMGTTRLNNESFPVAYRGGALVNNLLNQP